MAKVLDWKSAAMQILLKEVEAPVEVYAGLEADWHSTADCIYRNGEPVLDSHAFVASEWDTPVIQIGDGKKIRCAKTIPYWTRSAATTIWPKYALKVLKKA